MIEFHNVSKIYRNNTGIFNVNLKIDRNDIVILHGSNGSGKSTTIKLILNFLKLGKKDSGQIINNASKMSYIPEKISLPPFVTGEDFIKDILYLQKCNIDYQRYFDFLNLNPKIIIGSYSKGMRQKLGIIQALVTNSELILLDEPLTGLDLESQKKVIKLIEELKNKKTIIISTHYVEMFSQISTKVFHFEQGRIV